MEASCAWVVSLGYVPSCPLTARQPERGFHRTALFLSQTRERSSRYSLRIAIYLNTLSMSSSRCSASLAGDLSFQHSRSQEPQVCMGTWITFRIWSVQISPSDSQVNSSCLCLGARHHKQRKLLNPAFSTARIRDLTPLFHDIAEQESLIDISGDHNHSLKRISAASRCVTGIVYPFTGDRRRQDHEPLGPRNDRTRRTGLYVWAIGWDR